MKFGNEMEIIRGMLVVMLISILAAALTGCSGASPPEIKAIDREPGAVAAGIPDSAVFASSEESQALIDSIAAAGDYILKYQLSNGALSYRIDLVDDNRDYNPSHIRLIAGTGTLFTVCRVTGEDKYCQAGNKALAYYLNRVVDGGEVFGGACFYSSGTCKIGGAALAVDAIYKRWQATGETTLNGDNLLDTALQLGDHMVWMRNPDGGFNHMVDPFEGAINP